MELNLSTFYTENATKKQKKKTKRNNKKKKNIQSREQNTLLYEFGRDIVNKTVEPKSHWKIFPP